MATYSRDSFDRLKHYVNVRMQQGVHLVDADWNEKDDIRKDELRLFLKWFVGDGIPNDNDGFHILSREGEGDDFLIKGGESGQPGICLVDGWDVRSETDIAYTVQPLFNNDTLAQKWGVTPLAALTLPASGERTDLVYLEAWEREVDAQEDRELVNPAIGMETCVRLKREWVVRVSEGTTVLPSPEPTGHVFYPLATIKRKAGQPVIAQTDIIDLRRTGVSLTAIKEELEYYRAQNDLEITTLENSVANIGSKITILSAGGVKATSATLSSVNTWGDFPGLAITFTTPVTTKVMVSYQIAMPGASNHLCTRIMVDAVEVNRVICGNTAYWGVSQTWAGELAGGSHTIKIQYRTPAGGVTNPSGDDWQNRYLQVMVMGGVI